ncbi:MAG: tetratricopeptide repeat protein [Deltaproteobacteria bacterium]|nr:tetratricopeptide repeat protein [Deltaproteobacteria bacterium]
MRKLLLVCCACLGVFLGQARADSVEEIGEQRGEEQGGPKGSLGWFKAGVDLLRSGEHRAALARFERARSMSPKWALPHLEIAVVHLLTDNDRKAIAESLAKAVELGPEIPRAHYLYGVFLQEQGQRDQAVRHLVKALKLRPSMVDARFRLATLYVEQGRQVKGIEQFELVLGQRPSHMGSRRNLAVLYEQSGQLEQAERQLQAISQLFPNNAYHLTVLGRFYERVGWAGKAKAAYKRAERIEPSGQPRRMRPLLKSRD